MKRKVAIEWVEMLLSNPNAQADGMLCDELGNMCCLGVLTYIHNAGEPMRGGPSDEESHELEFLSDNTARWAGMVSHEGATVDPSGNLQKSRIREMKAEADADDGSVAHYVLYDNIAQANDRGASFEEIAMFIEKYSDVL